MTTWRCPYCDHDQTITGAKRSSQFHPIYVSDASEGTLGIQVTGIGCSNPDCLKTEIKTVIRPYKDKGGGRTFLAAIATNTLLPLGGGAKALPDYIPKGIRDDYREACLVRDLSPKASATLARRCLQGMIRDFAGVKVKSKKLVDEIITLAKAVEDGSAPRSISADSIGALNAVRSIGNIGAHMESDVDLIIDVDAGEAQSLIELIESLLEGWYVEREKQRAVFAKVQAIGQAKAKQIGDGRAAKAEVETPALAPPLADPEISG